MTLFLLISCLTVIFSDLHFWLDTPIISSFNNNFYISYRGNQKVRQSCLEHDCLTIESLEKFSLAFQLFSDDVV